MTPLDALRKSALTWMKVRCVVSALATAWMVSRVADTHGLLRVWHTVGLAAWAFVLACEVAEFVKRTERRR